MRSPPPSRPDEAHYRLTAGMDVDVLHRHLLLAFAAVPVERFEQRGEGAAELTRMRMVVRCSPGASTLLSGCMPASRQHFSGECLNAW